MIDGSSINHPFNHSLSGYFDTTSLKACATYSTLFVLRPQILIRPSLGRCRTWLGVRPVYENIPICDVMCDQSPGVFSSSSLSRKALRIWMIRPDISLIQSCHSWFS
ncbi:hypothetical protein DERF_005562 [Dermatophagoides farinae]|uniref:Uncharacterized protein n=1 Tax=Dermatophagoides farinae TaxID=6954 RepID=A0A922L8T6_DERFA|nr:hypothetical protein DERF_005562 [Dermatophagoides farinae]